MLYCIHLFCFVFVIVLFCIVCPYNMFDVCAWLCLCVCDVLYLICVLFVCAHLCYCVSVFVYVFVCVSDWTLNLVLFCFYYLYIGVFWVDINIWLYALFVLCYHWYCVLLCVLYIIIITIDIVFMLIVLAIYSFMRL